MRLRVRNKQVTGSIRYDGSVILGSSMNSFEERTEDDPYQPYRPGMPFSSIKTWRKGVLSGATRGHQVEQFAPLYNSVARLPFMGYDRTELELALTKHMAQVNPSSSKTSYSETLAELPSLPELFKFTGDTHLKKYGNAFLNQQFGWTPLIGDVLNFLFVVEDVNRMFDRIQRLSRKESFSSKRPLSSKRTPITVSREVLNSAGIWVEADVKRSYACSGHTFVRYSPDPSGVPSTDASQRILAYTAAKGLTAGAYEAWQLVPWSWLTDWSFNVSEYLKATRNVIGATCTESYAAVYARTVWEFDRLDVPTGLTWDMPPMLSSEHKERIPLSPTIFPTMPALSAGQIGILSALIAKWV